MLHYAWFASKLSDETECFMNVNQVCFSMKSLKQRCYCKNAAL
ncbi:hypothetical protein X975_01919, partial [Stegodyphus mimosarum]